MSAGLYGGGGAAGQPGQPGILAIIYAPAPPSLGGNANLALSATGTLTDRRAISGTAGITFASFAQLSATAHLAGHANLAISATLGSGGLSHISGIASLGITSVGALTQTGAKQIILTSGTSWTIPGDWNDGANTIEAIGGGAGGTATAGGHGADYAYVQNVQLSEIGVVAYTVGAGGAISHAGADTKFGSILLAKGGGSSSGDVGAITYSGGTGNALGGGGGAAGPNGNGGNAPGKGGGTGDNGNTPPDTNGNEWGVAGAGGGGTYTGTPPTLSGVANLAISASYGVRGQIKGKANITTTAGVLVPTPSSYVVPLAPNVETPTLTHKVHAAFTDGAGVTWTFDTYVGTDPTQPGIYGGFVNSAGKMHPGVVGKAYADGFDCGAMRMDNGCDYLGCTLQVTYDGTPQTIPYSTASGVQGLKAGTPSYIYLTGSTVNFWCGCCLPTIRYGTQVNWSSANIDTSVMPAYATSAQQQPYNESPSNYTMNGYGCSTSINMNNPGERADIGYFGAWDVAFLSAPSDSTWAVVRRASDYSGNWAIHFLHPETGRIIRITDFPSANYLPPAQQGGIKNNPIVPYIGSFYGNQFFSRTNNFDNSATPNVTSMEHPTGYAYLSAIVTRTARDLDHASFWANNSILGWNPKEYAVTYCQSGDPRAFAWNLRSVFLGAHYSSDTDYFMPQLTANRDFVLAQLNQTIPVVGNMWAPNQYGLLPYQANYVWEYDSHEPTPPNPDLLNMAGVSVWQHSYVMQTLDAVAYKDSAWIPFVQYIGGFYVAMTNSYLAPLGTTYKCMILLNGEIVPGATVLEGLAKIFNYSVMMNAATATALGTTQAQADAMTNAGNTVTDTYNALVANNTTNNVPWLGECVNNVSDFMGGDPTAVFGYPSMWAMAVNAAANAGTPNAAAALSYVLNVPSPPNYTSNKYHLGPRTG